MGTHIHPGTIPGGLTPICNSCGVSLCWDISETDYLEAKPFWEAWKCEDCHGSRMSAQKWIAANGIRALPGELQVLIMDFAAAHPQYEDDGIQGQSQSAATNFIQYLIAAGFKAQTTIITDASAAPTSA